MVENLTALFESWGIASAQASSQAEYLTNLPELLDQTWQTVYAPAAATVLAYLIGLPLGILLVTGEEGGIRPLPEPLMRVLNVVINLLRSVPFLILMALVMPLSTIIIGTSVGTTATIVPLTIAAAPYVARIVEISLREMDRGVIEAAQAMGCSPWQIVTKVMLPECRPSLINGLTTATITILSYGAMAGAIGAGGLGSMALMKGYQRQMTVMLWGSVILLVLLVQLIQSIGTVLSVKTDRRINPTESRRRKRK